MAVWWSAAAIVVGTVVGVAYFRVGADVWWPATVALYGPRWILLLPVAAAAGLAAVVDRPLLAPLALCAALLVGPFMGFQAGMSGMLAFEGERDLTVVTLNAAGGRRIVASPGSLMQEWSADLLLVQECRGPFRRSIEELETWHTAIRGSLCAVSRLPIREVTAMERDAFVQAGGSAQVLTYALDLGGRTVQVTNLHLETPRDGLELLLRGQIREGAEILRQKSILREIELRQAEQWARDAGPPALVLGDFNTPPESRHLRRAWGEWTDAFDVAGFGVGGTRLNGWIKARIDYVMAGPSWTVVSARVGESVGSDHLPVIARVRLGD